MRDLTTNEVFYVSAGEGTNHYSLVGRAIGGGLAGAAAGAKLGSFGGPAGSVIVGALGFGIGAFAGMFSED
ncbi:hypothetical protein M0D21_22840 [Aquimarina sp. D1M17]|uniref:hypothetical protein n=1 Tax=Aquimarina acroporae TaxID=2937283 RepID=UPI0020BF9F5E|nr:hypothetical protein [Aquimarina acroporae]MCK8524428.1 hypothetical protein [Aquimarina acroporae]